MSTFWVGHGPLNLLYRAMSLDSEKWSPVSSGASVDIAVVCGGRRYFSATIVLLSAFFRSCQIANFFYRGACWDVSVFASIAFSCLPKSGSTTWHWSWTS